MFTLKNIPNFLTVTRIFLALCFPLLSAPLQLPVVIIALLTEYFDGVLSRTFKWQSELGALLDPIADKLFVLSVLLTISTQSGMLWWQLILVLFRDIVVFGGALYLLFIEKNRAIFWRVRPRLLGKIATALQFYFMIYYFIMNSISDSVLFTTILLSLLAGVDYLFLLFKHDFYRGKSIKRI